jgi:predicted phosphoadenosine phosphosulfate sulfurtransferase
LYNANKGGVDGLIYKENNVFQEALERIRMLFDTHEDIIVCMSGGKDSTVVFNLALMVAKEKNRLPLKVFWLDQEAEWQHTVDYMNWVMRLPEVEPYWFQVPFDFPNNLSTQSKTLRVWDDTVRDKWIHPLSDIGIHESPLGMSLQGRDDAFYTLIRQLPAAITNKQCAVLVGMRMSESPRRRMSITGSNGKWHGITWCTNPIGTTRKFWPIYDFTDDDVWTAIAKNHWKYNGVYDIMYRWGTPKKDMRVSALIHETSWHAIEMLQEFEKDTYNKFCARVPGVSTFNHSFDEGGIVPRTLPFAFKDWKEYRDYLLFHIIPTEDIPIYQERWKKQDGDDWYRIHVKELILNDTCGTVNQNHMYQVYSKGRLAGKYKNKDVEKFKAYMEEKNGNQGSAD